MKFAVNKSVFLVALQHVHSVVERRNTIPILSNVLLEAKEEGIFLTATDMDIQVLESIEGSEVEIMQMGTVTTSAQMLYDIVRKLPDNIKVELYSENSERLAVKASSSSFALNCLPAEDFPSFPGEAFKNTFKIESKDLIRLIDKTSFAMSMEETRYYLNGIYMHTIEEKEKHLLRTVATDGHRLSRVDMSLPEGANSVSGVIIPRKTIMEVRKLIEDNKDKLHISLDETRIRFTLGKVILTSKLLDGTFPDYSRVIPEDGGNEKIVNVSNESLSQAVDRVSTVSTDKSRAIKMNVQKDTISITANNPDQGSASENIGIEYKGEGVEIGFNSKYVLDVSRQLKGKNMLIKLSDSVSPTLIFDEEDESALFVLMPMRV